MIHWLVLPIVVIIVKLCNADTGLTLLSASKKADARLPFSGILKLTYNSRGLMVFFIARRTFYKLFYNILYTSY
jgi:hypothetical protein